MPNSDSSNVSACCTSLDKLMVANKLWSDHQTVQDPEYFERLCNQQAPEFFWIGCADSRVPANVILGLEPGEVFVQRNVGNQAMHVDLNCMACLEYAVTALKVKVIIVCGHYGCGAVNGALRMPSKTSSLVNCWISDIRECRNQHEDELRAMDDPTQVDRLVELNVMRQTFHVCTSHVVQAAWDQGQQLEVYGVVYNLKDGLMNRLVGPFANNNTFSQDIKTFERVAALSSASKKSTPRNMIRVMSSSGGVHSVVTEDQATYMINTAKVAEKVLNHVAWSDPSLTHSTPAGKSTRITEGPSGDALSAAAAELTAAAAVLMLAVSKLPAGAEA